MNGMLKCLWYATNISTALNYLSDQNAKLYSRIRVPDYMHMAIAYFIWGALNDDKIYQTYMADKEVRMWLGLTSR